MKKVLADIESGDFISGIADFGPLITDVQDSLSTCQNMTDDLARLNEWAHVFKDPMDLGQRVMNNAMKYMSQIMANIN